MKIEYFYDIIAVYNEKSIKKAAIERGLSEVTLRNHLELIEAEIGEPIIKITSKKVELTEEGMAFYLYAMRALEDFSAYKKENLKETEYDEMNIGMDINVFLGSMYTCSSIVSKKYKTRFNIVQQYKDDVIDGVRFGNFDTGLVILDGDTKEKIAKHNLDYKFVCTRRPVAIIGSNHPLAKYDSITLKDLEDYKRIALKNSFEEFYFFENNNKMKQRLKRSNLVYKYIGDVLMALKHGDFYFIGGCNEYIDLGLSGLKVLEVLELQERVDVGCIYNKSKGFLDPLNAMIEVSEEIKKL